MEFIFISTSMQRKLRLLCWH